MTSFEAIGFFYVLLTALLGTAVLLYLAWLGGKCVQRERGNGISQD